MSQAKVTSIEAVAMFKAALVEFEADARDTMTTIKMEMQRALNWIDDDRAKYWPKEVRKAINEYREAKMVLENAQISLRPEDTPSCHQEKKVVEQTKRRMHLAEEKERKTKEWQRTLFHENEEFQGQLGRMISYLDGDIPRAIASIERIIRALDEYAEQQSSTEAVTSDSPEGPTK